MIFYLTNIFSTKVQHYHLDEITKNVIETLKQTKIETNVSNATVNRMLAVLRGILKRSVEEWEWLDKSPHIRLLPEATRRIRWLTHEEAKTLRSCLAKH